MKPEKVGNFIRGTMDEKQANKKNPQFGWSETQKQNENINNEWQQWMICLQAFNVCTNQNVKENLSQEQMKFQELLKSIQKVIMHINQPACPSLCSTWTQLVAPVYYLPFDPCGWSATTLETQILTKFEQVMDTRIKFLVQPPSTTLTTLSLSLSRHQSQGGHSHSSWYSWQEIK
jgi:hypothetical protein